MSKLDAAIELLRNRKEHLFHVNANKRERASCGAAIRLLEAAEKVDKEDLILTVRAMMLVCQTTSDDEKSLDNLLEFLAALPED